MATGRPTTSYPSSVFPQSRGHHPPSLDPRRSRAPSLGSVPSTEAQSSLPLSVVLLESQPFALTAATESPFLRAAAQGTLSKALVSKWLSQARLVTQAQMSLLGALIARVDLPYALLSEEAQASSVRWRAVNVLTTALTLAQSDLAFYVDVARRYDLNLEFPPRVDVYFTADWAAKRYIDLFRAFWTDPTMTLLEGMVVFWSTMQCRTASWRYVCKNWGICQHRDGGAMLKEFMPRWTAFEFDRFVAELAEVMDLLADREDAWKRQDVYRRVWQHVLEIERRMWPEM